MIVYPTLLFCRLKILCVFFAPRSPEKTEPPRFRQRLGATGNRLGRTPNPIAVTPTVYDHLPTVATCSVLMGFAGGWRGSWRPESPWLGAPDLLKPSVSVFRAFHALAGI